MEPVFTMQYGEYAVAEILSKKIKGASVFIPTSAQEKGIDMLLYNHTESGNKVITVQVKMSRTYFGTSYANLLWFNRFIPQPNADLFILVGIFPTYKIGHNKKSANLKSGKQWDEVFIVFTYDEMVDFMENLRLKTNPEKYDGKFSFSFDNKNKIFLTRGKPQIEDYSEYLLPNRIDMITNMINNQ